MSNIIIGYNNRIDLATLTGGNWTATLPRANIQNRLISKVARTSGDAIADATINIDFGTTYAIGLIALVGHNISVVGKVRIRGDNAGTFASSLYDSGWVSVWPGGVVPIEMLEWEGDNFWLGTISAADRAGFQAPFIQLNTSRTVARYWRIEVDDTTNVSTYIQIGRIFMSDYWHPEINYSYGASLGYEDETNTQKSVGGQEFFDNATRYRVMKLQLDWIAESEAYVQALELQRLLGISGELLVVPDSADLANAIRRNFLGRLRSLATMQVARQGRYSNSLEIKESL